MKILAFMEICMNYTLSKFRKASERKLKIFDYEKNEDLKILTVGRKYIDEDGEIYSIIKFV